MDSLTLIDITYKGKNRVVTHLIGREGTFRDENFLPYFYVIPHDEKSKEEIKKLKVGNLSPEKIEEVERIDLKRKVKALKIYLRHPKEIQEWREVVKPFGERREMDIPFTRRYMIDHDLRPMTEVKLPEVRRGEKEIGELKVLAFDIETLAGNAFAIGENPIIMLSLWGEGIKKVITWNKVEGEYVEVVENEKELIRRFVRIVNEYKPEVIVGYNCDAFDWPCIKKRASKFKINLLFNGENLTFVRRGRESAPKIPGMNPVDLYVFVSNILAPYMQSESLDLNTVAAELIGEEKIKIGGMKGIDSAWEKNRELLYRYSLQDARLTYLLAMEILPMIYELAKIIGQPISDVARMTPSQVVEWLLVREAFKQGILAPNRPKTEEIARRRQFTYEGAFVKEPKKGLCSPIAVCDFRSLYPTIIMAHNISPDTINCEHEECRKSNTAPNGVWFCTKEKGFLPRTIEKLFRERIELKKKLKSLKKGTHEYKMVDTRQKALKLILNSFYGYMGFPGARWYSIEAASAVTAWGRKYITEIMKKAEEKGFQVVYGDTDSVMLSAEGKNFKERVLEFLQEVNSSLPEPMELELEGFYVRGLFVTKKRYALLAEDGSLVIKGLERVRRDWSDLAREAQEKVLRLVLENRVEEAKRYVQELVEKIRKKEIPMERMIIRTQLTKEIEEYEQIGPHVKVAMDLRREGKPVFPGMIIEYVVTPGTGSISERSVWAEYARDYDAEYYIENQLLPAVMRILEAVGSTEEELRRKQSTLDSFL